MVHQHWVQQLLCAGSFNLHCTESGEAKHKHVQKQAALRVKIEDAARTQGSMLNYVKNNLLFRDLATQLLQPRAYIKPVVRRSKVTVVSYPLKSNSGPVGLGTNFRSTANQARFIHPSVRLARFELFDLLCDKFGYRKTLNSYAVLESLSFNLGQKLVLPNGDVYWATDTDYVTSAGRRRDIVRLQKSEEVDVDDPVAATQVKKLTAMTCQLICFLHIEGIQRLQDTMHFKPPECILNHVDHHNGTLDLILTRFFAAHPSAYERDTEHRPVCPGTLRINHCLWRYANCSQPRGSLQDPHGEPTDAFRRHKHFFGATSAEQRLSYDSELHAYYTLIFPSQIKSRSNMTQLFVSNTEQPSADWLECVTLI